MMKRVLCNATVDRTDDHILVTVIGVEESTGLSATYEFPLDETDDSAAMESIRRFTNENGGTQ